MSYLLNTGFLYGLLNQTDKHHPKTIEVLHNLNSTVYLPTVVTTEVGFLVLKYLGVNGLINFLGVLGDPDGLFVMVEPIADDYKRALRIVQQYNDTNIDFVNAALVAIAERMNITRILTVDQRHFRLFRPTHCLAFEIFP